jgi:hypothetical protein
MISLITNLKQGFKVVAKRINVPLEHSQQFFLRDNQNK